MARKKKPANSDYSSVKCGLGTVLREEFRLPLISIISQMSITATKIASLASLLFLYKVNCFFLFVNEFSFQFSTLSIQKCETKVFMEMACKFMLNTFRLPPLSPLLLSLTQICPLFLSSLMCVRIFRLLGKHCY